MKTDKSSLESFVSYYCEEMKGSENEVPESVFLTAKDGKITALCNLEPGHITTNVSATIQGLGGVNAAFDEITRIVKECQIHPLHWRE